MPLADSLKQLRQISKTDKLGSRLPYGHPDMVYPTGAAWKIRKDNGQCGPWSNKPWQTDFHTAGQDHPERMLMAANRVGKTDVAAYEVAAHATGKYPDWWEGKRFNKGILVWCGSVTNEASRDIVQKALLGGLGEELGTGYIPAADIIGEPRKRPGSNDGVEFVKVRHVSGDISTIVFKSYDQGWRKWQGTAPDVVWLDEEPEESNANEQRIFSECLTRILSSRGVLMVTFTPLLGETAIVQHFMQGGPGIYLGTATWEDAPHLDEAETERLKRSFPPHELEARTKGVPMMGEGRVFTEAEEAVVVQPISIPRHWPRIIGIDFGLDHPASAVELAWDRDTDTVYVTWSWKRKGVDAAVHVSAIRKRGVWIPVSWPHDGAKRDRAAGTAGKELIQYYREEGLNALSKSARYKNDTGGGQAVWPIIETVRERESTGRFKIFSTCTEYLDERRSYHVKEGHLARLRDDALKAAFYALMMLRYARTETGPRRKPAPATPYMTSRV